MDPINFQKLLNPDNSKKVTNIEPIKQDEDTLDDNIDVETVSMNAASVAESKAEKKTEVKKSKLRHSKPSEKKPELEPVKESKIAESEGSESEGSESESEETGSVASSISNMSENRKNQADDETFSNLTDVRREFLNKIQRFKSMGYKVPDLKGDEPLDQLHMIFDSLKYEQRFQANIRFFRLIIRFLGWVVEQVTVRIGFSSLKGFGTHVSTVISDFDEFYEDMTEPVYEKRENGEYVKIEKHNIFSYVTSRPEINLITRFGTLAVAYSAANKVETLAELMAD